MTTQLNRASCSKPMHLKHSLFSVTTIYDSKWGGHRITISSREHERVHVDSYFSSQNIHLVSGHEPMLEDDRVQVFPYTSENGTKLDRIVVFSKIDTAPMVVEFSVQHLPPPGHEMNTKYLDILSSENLTCEEKIEELTRLLNQHPLEHPLFPEKDILPLLCKNNPLAGCNETPMDLRKALESYHYPNHPYSQGID